MTLDKIAVNKMTIEEMVLNKMTVDKLHSRQHSMVQTL